MPQGVSVRQATSPEDLEAVIKCFHTYTEWLDEDLTHQNYAAELDQLPGKYAPPTGALLIATDSDSGQTLGCIALRPLELPPDHSKLKSGAIKCCEVKRLFVYPEARGRQVARKLVKEVLQKAEEEGYDEIFLDSLSRMGAAIRLYQSEGFTEVAPYNVSPLDGTVYYSKSIATKI